MAQKTTASRNIIDLTSYRRRTLSAADQAPAPRRTCRHCGAWLADDESDDDCSSVFRAFETTGTRL